MVLSTFGTRIANRGSRQCQDAVNLYLAVLSIMMVRYMPTRCVMIGVRVLKIITRPQQRPTFSCTCHRSLRLKANHELEPVAENEAAACQPREE